MNNIAAQGRYGDNAVAHVNKSELMIPPELQTPEVMAAFQQAAMQAGVDPMQFIAGAPQNSVNPATGMPEYGLGPGGAGASGGQANDGGAGPGGMGDGGAGGMGDGGGFGGRAYGQDDPQNYSYDATMAQKAISMLGNLATMGFMSFRPDPLSNKATDQNVSATPVGGLVGMAAPGIGLANSISKATTGNSIDSALGTEIGLSGQMPSASPPSIGPVGSPGFGAAPGSQPPGIPDNRNRSLADMLMAQNA
jgi:hypothetical protein